MRSWSDLAADFGDAFGSGASYVRLDYTTGYCGETWRLAGSFHRAAELRFLGLASIAGDKLLELPSIGASPVLVQEPDSVKRWYRALVELSGASELHSPFIAIDDDGNALGTSFAYSIQRIAEVSAAMCVALEGKAVAPSRRIEALSAVPRYSGPCQHWQEARQLLDSGSPKYARIAHESVSAVEGMCRVILADSSITLGAGLKKLGLRPGIRKSIEGVWGLASAEQGVRHGGASPASISQFEAAFVLGVCEAALVFMLAIDAGQQPQSA